MNVNINMKMNMNMKINMIMTSTYWIFKKNVDISYRIVPI
jgi:hypothetical protein